MREVEAMSAMCEVREATAEAGACISLLGLP